MNLLFKVNIIILLLFVNSCSLKQKFTSSYPPSIINELYSGCYNSTKELYKNKNKVNPREETLITYCNCAIKQLTSRTSFSTLAQQMVVQNYSLIKNAGDTCKQISPVQSAT